MLLGDVDGGSGSVSGRAKPIVDSSRQFREVRDDFACWQLYSKPCRRFPMACLETAMSLSKSSRPRRIIRPKEGWQRLGIGHSKFYKDFVATGRIRLVPLGALARGVFEHELEGVMDELAVAAEAGEHRPAPSPSRQSSPSSSTPSPTRPSPKRRISAGRPAARR
jgi:hypothetical protein